MSGDARGDGGQTRVPPLLPPRRVFVVGGVAAALAVLVDHGLRLDLPQPPPRVPTRRPAPDERLLVGVVRDLDDILSVWPRAGGTRQLAVVRRLLTAQRVVLEGRLTNAGVPTSEIGRAASTTTGTAPLSRAALARRLRAVDPAVWKATASATTTTRELLTAAYGIRLAGAELAGAAVPLAKPSPVRGGLLERTSPMVYAFEVVAAQSKGTDRKLALLTLAMLRTLEREVAADLDTSQAALTRPTGAAELPGGWSLPWPVTDEATALRLGDHVLQVAMASTADALGAAPTAASVEDVARWAGRVDAIASGWGIALKAFPGATP